MRFEFTPSAFKHGCTRAQIITAWQGHLGEFVEGEDPLKIIRVGVDTQLRVLEIGAHVTGSEVLVFHAMPARTRYVKMMSQHNQRRR